MQISEEIEATYMDHRVVASSDEELILYYSNRELGLDNDLKKKDIKYYLQKYDSNLTLKGELEIELEKFKSPFEFEEPHTFLSTKNGKLHFFSQKKIHEKNKEFRSLHYQVFDVKSFSFLPGKTQVGELHKPI